MIDRFVTVYEPSPPRWSNITSVVNDLELPEFTAQTMAEYLDLQGIDRRFTRELVEAATRVNYGQVSASSLASFIMIFIRSPCAGCRQNPRPGGNGFTCGERRG